jgi:preprotein translocase subunit SecE
MTIANRRSLIALILSLVLIVSLFTVGAAATESTSTTAETTAAASESASESTSETTTKSETTTSAEDAAKKELEKIKADKTTTLLINGVIIGVIVVIIALVAVKFRKKLGGFMRSVKSELKKIVWSSKENTRKGFLVVVVVAVATAILLGLIDLAFNTGISMLASLFN